MLAQINKIQSGFKRHSRLWGFSPCPLPGAKVPFINMWNSCSGNTPAKEIISENTSFKFIKLLLKAGAVRKSEPLFRSSKKSPLSRALWAPCALLGSHRRSPTFPSRCNLPVSLEQVLTRHIWRQVWKPCDGNSNCSDLGAMFYLVVTVPAEKDWLLGIKQLWMIRPYFSLASVLPANNCSARHWQQKVLGRAGNPAQTFRLWPHLTT